MDVRCREAIIHDGPDGMNLLVGRVGTGFRTTPVGVRSVTAEHVDAKTRSTSIQNEMASNREHHLHKCDFCQRQSRSDLPQSGLNGRKIWGSTRGDNLQRQLYHCQDERRADQMNKPFLMQLCYEPLFPTSAFIWVIPEAAYIKTGELTVGIRPSKCKCKALRINPSDLSLHDVSKSLSYSSLCHDRGGRA